MIKFFFYQDCAGFDREVAFQKALLFPDQGDCSFRAVASPAEADFFTVPFSLELIAEVSGERRHCVNFVNNLAYIKNPRYSKKHFFITNDPSFPAELFPCCRFFKTCLPAYMELAGDYIPPFVAAPAKATPIRIPRKNWGVITAYNSVLRSRLLSELATMGGVDASDVCRGVYDQKLCAADNIWLGPRRNKIPAGSGHYALLMEGLRRNSARIVKNTRFVICPLTRQGDYTDVLTAMAFSRIPVVITDELQLPWEHSIDFREFGFILGATRGDMLKLCDIAGLPDKHYRQMAQRAREVWQQHFAPVILRRRLSAMLVAGASSAAARRPHPLPPPDEHSLLRCFWETLADRFSGLRDGGLVLFGAGKILKKLLAGLAAAGKTPWIAGIADDDKSLQGAVFSGFTVHSLDYYRNKNIAAVILATDTFETAMTKRIHAVLGSDKPVISLAGFFTEYGATAFDRYRTAPNTEWELGAASVDDGVFKINYKPTGRLRPSRLEGLTVCVGQADALRWTLPGNIKHFDSFTVVSSVDDYDTHEIVRKYGAQLVVSDAYKAKGDAFNKGRMLNAGMTALKFDDWCIVMDADIILHSRTRDYIFSRVLNDSVLYFTSRHNIPGDNSAWWLKNFFSTGKYPAPPIFIGEPEPYGFFQLFHARAGSLKNRKRKIFSEAFNNAGGVDFHFSMLWANSLRCSIAYIPIKTLHIPHGRWGVNWSGPGYNKSSGVETDNGNVHNQQNGWRQIAYHSSTSLTVLSEFPTSNGYLKYTRSDTGEYIVIPFSPKMIKDKSSPFVLGKKINGVFTCGISSGQKGDVTLFISQDGKEYSGWGVGVLTGSSVPGRCWNGKLMNAVADFDISFKKSAG